MGELRHREGEERALVLGEALHFRDGEQEQWGA